MWFDIILLYAPKNKEPGCLISSSTTGKIYSHIFNNWKEAVHFIGWCDYNEYDEYDDCDEWHDLYHDNDDNFSGDLNEYLEDMEYSACVTMVNTGEPYFIDDDTDLYKISVYDKKLKNKK